MIKQLNVTVLGDKLHKILNRNDYKLMFKGFSINAVSMYVLMIDNTLNNNLYSDLEIESFNGRMSYGEKISAIKELAAAGLVKTNIYEWELVQ